MCKRTEARELAGPLCVNSCVTIEFTELRRLDLKRLLASPQLALNVNAVIQYGHKCTGIPFFPGPLCCNILRGKSRFLEPNRVR